MLWGFRDSGLAARRRRTAWRRAGWAGDGVELWRQAGSASAIRRRVRLHPVRSASVRTSAIAAGPWPAVAPGIAAVGGWKHHEVSIPMVGAWLGWQPASAGRLAGAIEQAGDPLVGHLARQLAHERQRVLGNGPATLAGRVHLELQRRVVAALPMQHHADEPVVDARDDLLECRAQDPLARRRACAGCDRARARSAPSRIRCWRSFSPSAAGFLASSSAISVPIPCTAASASFQRRSNSPATSRLAGSTESYCRRACTAS